MSKLPPLKSGFVKNLDQPADEFAFHRVFVDQLKMSRTSILDNIHQDICVPDYTNIRILIDNLLAKRRTTKEKLAVWIETMCCILDQYAIPWLEKAAPLSDEVEKLKSEKIVDQKTASIRTS